MIDGEKIAFGKDLPERRGIETRAVKQAVKGNTARVPIDFMFVIRGMEMEGMVSQIRRGLCIVAFMSPLSEQHKYPPYTVSQASYLR